MNARNVPIANNPTCHAVDNANAEPTAENRHPTDRQAIAKPLVQISMMKNTRAAMTQICQISMIFVKFMLIVYSLLKALSGSSKVLRFYSSRILN